MRVQINHWTGVRSVTSWRFMVVGGDVLWLVRPSVGLYGAESRYVQIGHKRGAKRGFDLAGWLIIKRSHVAEIAICVLNFAGPG
jgi:hypothetical protein